MRSTNLVETGDAMSSAVTSEMLDKIVVREIANSGSREAAMDKICRTYGFTRAQIKHLRGGRAKDVKLSLFQKVRFAYLDYCEKQIAALQHEIQIEKAKHSDADLGNLEGEVEALAAKVARAKAR